MKIREKLLLGFSIYLLLALIAGAVAYTDLRKITKSLTLVEVADDLTNTILEVRRYEKNYLLFRDDHSLQEFRNYMTTLRQNLDNMKTEIIHEIGTADYAMLKKTITSFEDSFSRVRQDFAAQDELIESIRNEGRRIETRLSGRMLQSFLILRKYEKNVMLYKDADSFSIYLGTYRSSEFGSELKAYHELMKKLFALYEDEKTTVEAIRTKARQIQSFTENLSKKERAKIGSVLSLSMKLLVIGLIVISIIGAFFNLKLATSIATPIRRLEKVTKKIAAGDFSESVEVTGKDEIASLELSFNQMVERLKDAMSSLEHTIEKLKEKQTQLVETEKLAAIGKLAAGIAHEINNPLTSVLTFSSLMLEQMPGEDPRHERLKIIVRDTTRARNIVRQVLSFAREAPLRTVRMNVNRPVAEMIESLRSQDAFAGIQVIQELALDLPDIEIDPLQIGQVVTNILLNAVHAITPPGRITVETRKAGGFVELAISDTGKGISADHLKKIFDPFFTTKDKTKGTGLGLAVTYGIIKKHGGSIEVESETGKGTTFTVRLPISGEQRASVQIGD